MTRLVFSKGPDGHFYLPMNVYGSEANSIGVSGFVDTGASKCQILREANNVALKLKVHGHDSDVSTASGHQVFDVVTIPRITLMRITVRSKVGSLLVEETDLEERNVEAWVGDMFILGMNFLSKFDIQLKRTGRIIISRSSYQ